MTEGKQVAFAEIAAAMEDRRAEGRGGSIDEILNKQVEISKVEVVLSQDGGELLVIHLVDGKRYRSGSKVLLKQAVHIKAQIDAGKTVVTTITRKQSKQSPNKYYTFT
jgi:hypothetical protein